MMGWLIVLCILVLLAITPVGVHAGYNSEGILLQIVAGPVRITILPAKKKEKKTKEKKPKPEKKKPVKEAKPAPAAEQKTEKGGSVTDFLPLLQIVFDFLGEFRRKLRVDRLELKLILAGGDPATLGIKKRDVAVECDFTGSKTLIIARLQITITIGRIVSMAVRYAIRGLRGYLKIVNKRKGGNVK